jgi:hypothetical protein
MAAQTVDKILFTGIFLADAVGSAIKISPDPRQNKKRVNQFPFLYSTSG